MSPTRMISLAGGVGRVVGAFVVVVVSKNLF